MAGLPASLWALGPFTLGLRGLRSASKLNSSVGFCRPNTSGEMVSALGAMDTASRKMHEHGFEMKALLASKALDSFTKMRRIGGKSQKRTFRLSLWRVVQT